MTQTTKRFTDSYSKLRYILKREIGQICTLGMPPNSLNRVQIRSIPRKPLNLKPIRMLLCKQPERLLVSRVVVQDQKYLPSEVYCTPKTGHS